MLLAGSGEKLSPAAFPTLKKLAGMTLITTDGTTLLGADDKAGIAEIMTALESIISEKKPHGKLCIAFTPDEEVGSGVDHFDVEKFGAVYAYTVDGGEEGEIAYETFNACSAEVAVEGLSVHPGSAKDTMINAALVAMEFNALLPAADIPRLTEGYEGFYHLCQMTGDESEAVLHWILRDHDRAAFTRRKETMERIAAFLCEEYGPGSVEVTLTDSYQNMKEAILPHPQLLTWAREAFRKVGVEPRETPIRGGTDGAQLSQRGLPCPNLSTGGYHFHGIYEYIPVESLDKMTEMLEELLVGIDKTGKEKKV